MSGRFTGTMRHSRARGYNTFSMLISADHKNLNAHNY